MDELKKRIYDKNIGLYYTLVGDYYIPDLKLSEKSRPIGKLWTYLADLNESVAITFTIGQKKLSYMR